MISGVAGGILEVGTLKMPLIHFKKPSHSESISISEAQQLSESLINVLETSQKCLEFEDKNFKTFGEKKKSPYKFALDALS